MPSLIRFLVLVAVLAGLVYGGLFALANFVKGLLKLAVVGSVLTALMWPERRRFEAKYRAKCRTECRTECRTKCGVANVHVSFGIKISR